MTGRTVRVLADGDVTAAGIHEIAWDGLDTAGRPVAPGVYFARLETSRYRFIERMTLLR